MADRASGSLAGSYASSSHMSDHANEPLLGDEDNLDLGATAGKGKKEKQLSRVSSFAGSTRDAEGQMSQKEDLDWESTSRVQVTGYVPDLEPFNREPSEYVPDRDPSLTKALIN
jgi:hypothetical protein